MSINVTPEMLQAFRVHPDGCRCPACGVITTAIDDEDDMFLNGHPVPSAIVEDRECLGLLMHLDQTRTTVRTTLANIPAEALAGLIKRCAEGKVAELNETEGILVGLLATIGIFDLKHTPPPE